METLTGVMTKKYGCLHAETWQDDFRRGFNELLRVLSPGGTLIFKFADTDTDFSTVLKLAPEEPLFGTTTKNKKNHETRWFVFYKSARDRSVQPDTASEWTHNTPHPSRGRRIAHEPGIASPDPIRQARSCQRGHGTGPLSRAGILALQGGEDVKEVR